VVPDGPLKYEHIGHVLFREDTNHRMKFSRSSAADTLMIGKITKYVSPSRQQGFSPFHQAKPFVIGIFDQNTICPGKIFWLVPWE
jgi:curli biogenesis system outer membrane secretion channel CsgG